MQTILHEQTLASPLFGVEEKVILVTGGGLLSNIFTHALLEAGAYVVLSGPQGFQDEEPIRYTEHENLLVLKSEQIDPDAVQEVVTATLDTFGRIDALVNHAPMSSLDPSEGDGRTLFSEERWDEDIGHGLRSVFLYTRAVAPYLIEQGRGTVINVSSILGLVGPPLSPARQHDQERQPLSLAVTGSALLGLTRYLATYWAGAGIRVNTLSVGGWNEDPAAVRFHSVLGRPAQANEYTGALLFLLSDASSYMTGSNLVIDGGWTAW